MRSRGSAILFGLVLVTSIRCAHAPMTPQQRACKKRVSECLEQCGEQPGPAQLSGDGCESTTQTKCEERCYEDCW